MQALHYSQFTSEISIIVSNSLFIGCVICHLKFPQKSPSSHECMNYSRSILSLKLKNKQTTKPPQIIMCKTKLKKKKKLVGSVCLPLCSSNPYEIILRPCGSYSILTLAVSEKNLTLIKILLFCCSDAFMTGRTALKQILY